MRTPQQQEQQRKSSVGLAMLGAICCSVVGTLVTTSLGASPTIRITGAAVGAALAPMIGAAGRFHRLRVGVGLLVTAVALAITYGGFTMVDAATGRDSPHLPLPGDDSNTNDDDLSASTTTPDIKVTPASLDLPCAGPGCVRVVRVTSTGTAPLQINEIEIDGAASGFGLTDSDCEHKRLTPGQACQISVWLISSPTPARLIIHQNLPGDPTYIQLNIPTTDSPDRSPPQQPPSKPPSIKSG